MVEEPLAAMGGLALWALVVLAMTVIPPAIRDARAARRKGHRPETR